MPYCDCPAPTCRSYHDLRAACGHLLRILRTSGVIARPVVPASPVGDEPACFDGYMRDAQGLAGKTGSGRIGIVQRFLPARFADRQITLSALQPADVRQFIAEQLEQCGTTSKASALASALKAYFRYRTVCGDRVHALMGAIARPAHWDLASLPRSLSPDEVDRLLASFTAGLPSPRCAVHWIWACASAKSPSSRLPTSTGKTARSPCTEPSRAGRIYCRCPPPPGRRLRTTCYSNASTTNPAVFVRCLAPHDVPIGVDAVRRVVRDAYRRIGLKHTRAHALRHTLACLPTVRPWQFAQGGG